MGHSLSSLSPLERGFDLGCGGDTRVNGQVVLEAIVDDRSIESRRYDEVRSGVSRLHGLIDVQHGTSSGEHLGLFLRDATQRIESARSAKRDLGDRQPAGQQRAPSGTAFFGSSILMTGMMRQRRSASVIMDCCTFIFVLFYGY